MEVLLATAVFIVVIGSMVSLSRLSLRNGTIAMHRTQAVNLAEDGIEAVRHMRDTNWITQGGYGATVDDLTRWKAFVHSCGQDLANSPYEVPATNTGTQKYGLCFDEDLNRFGLLTAPDKIRPGYESSSPDESIAQFTREISFEPLDDTEVSNATKGLQLLQGDTNGQPTRAIAAESTHFIKVKVVVRWRDFDQDWSTELTTLLSNWKGQ